MKKVSLILKLLATGTLTTLLAACYGTIQVMYGVPYGQRSGTIRVQREGDGDEPIPIPGIKVTYTTYPDYSQPEAYWSELGTGYTDGTGMLGYSVYLDDHETLTVRLEDVDEGENGGLFDTQEINVDESVETVTMTLKSDS
jgi:hypothetical protein